MKKIEAVKENGRLVKSAVKKNGKLFLFIGVILALTVIILNAAQIFITSRTAKAKIQESSEISYTEFTKGYSVVVRNNMKEYFAHLDFYTNAEVVKSRDTAQIWAWLRSVSDKRHKEFDYVAWCDVEGKFFSDINTTTNVKDRDYWQAIMQNGADWYVDNPVTSKSSGITVVHICQAAKVDGQTIGFFCAVVQLDHLSKILDDIQLGDIGYAVLYGSDGRVIATSTEDSEFLADIDWIKENRPMDFEKISAEWNSKDRTAFDIINSKKKSQYVIVESVVHTPWRLFVFLNEDVIFKAANAVKNLLFLGGLVMVVFMLVIVGAILFKSIQPLTVVEKTILGIASGDADLTKRIEIDTNNEIGRVVDGFNQFTSKLQTIVTSMKDSKEELFEVGEMLSDSTSDTSDSIKQIIGNIESMNENMNQQNDSVHQTAGAVNEIAANIESLNRMIESQSASVTQASAAVEEMIGNIATVNGSVQKMANAFEMLDEKTQVGVQKQTDVNMKIVEIERESQALQEANSVISGIAEQTNLLAMNAAIEAAHAGEAGKGFSVVADEIRKLSEDASAQSQTIGNQLSKITLTINEIVSVSQIAADAFNEVSSEIALTNNLVHEITNAMEEQNAGSHQISIALQSMNSTSNEVKTSSFEMAEGNKAILAEIKTLQEATFAIKDGMEEMSAGARKIDETGAALSELSRKMDDSIKKIGEQVDQFKV